MSHSLLSEFFVCRRAKPLSGEKLFPLPGIPDFHFVMDGVQYLSLVGTPQRCHQKVFGAVAGDPVDDDGGIQMLNAADEDVHVFFHGKQREGKLFQICAPQHMHELQLDAVDAGVGQIICGGQHIIGVFPGQAQDDMDDNGETGCFQPGQGVLKHGQRIAPADEAGGAVMDGLQAKFDHAADRLDDVDTAAKRINGDLTTAKDHAGKVAKELYKPATAADAVASAVEQADQRIKKFSDRVKGLVKRVFIFTMITAALRSMKDWMGKVVQSNSEASAAVARLKGALLTLAQPILSVLIPAFTALVNILTRIVSAIAGMVSLLFGKTIGQAKDAAKNMYDEAEAIEATGGAAKKASKSLASFDEINKLSNSASGGGGGSAAKPDFSFDTSSMASDFEKILNWVNLIGAALLAWKLSKGFKDGLTKFVGLLVAIRGGIDLAKGAWDAWQNGVSMDNFLEMLKGAAELTLGLWIAFGKLGAGIGMVVSGLSLFATGLHDALKNGWNFENMLSTVAGLLISGLGIAVLTGSWIPLLVAAIAGLLLVFTNAFGQGQVMLDGIKLLLEGFLEFFKGIFTGDLTLTINGIQLLVQGLQTIVEAVLTALQTAVDTFFTWLDEQTNGRLSGLLEWIRTTLNSWIETLKLTLKNLVSSIGQILTGIVTFVSGVFTGKWRQAWEGVKDIFRGIWNTIVDLLEGGINFIIDGINAFIRGVNKAFALIGALTGRSVSIDTLPRVELPRLAAGAVIPPNKEFLAVLGDQKQGTNIETPLDTMVQAFRQALSEGGYSGQSTAYLVIDEDILGKVVYRLNKSESNRVGVSLEDY